MMIPDTAPKPASKSAPHRRVSSSGVRTFSTSVTTDPDPTTASLSLSSSNQGDCALQSRPYNTRINNNNKHSKNATDTNRGVTLDADADDRDGDSLAQCLPLSLPDLVATSEPLSAPPPPEQPQTSTVSPVNGLRVKAETRPKILPLRRFPPRRPEGR